MDFASYLDEIGERTCSCGYTGKVYMFVTVNGKEQCVRCAGSEEIKPTKGMLIAAAKMGSAAAKKARAAKRGSEKQRKVKFVEMDE